MLGRSMRVTCQPSISQWQPALDGDRDRGDLALLLESTPINEGVPIRVDRLLATGHQPLLWHSGIAAKDLAMVAAARRFEAGVLHLVVDHDVLDTIQLQLPRQDGDRLGVHTVQLVPHNPAVPVGCQDAVDPAQVIATIREAAEQLGSALVVELTPILDACAALKPCRTLAEQLAQLTAILLRPCTGLVPLLFSGSFGGFAPFDNMVDEMVRDAARCAKCYNHALSVSDPAAAVKLRVGRSRVELPLWLLHDNEPRKRVFVETSASQPILSTGDGKPIESGRLAPRAMLLSVIMRRLCCDLFIHGMGGQHYDLVAERWWRSWSGTPLAPTAVVSADLMLPFDAPLADGIQLDRALWWQHHLPHNLDRAFKLDGADAVRKRDLLARMNDDRDRCRRAHAYAELHAINRRLVDAHPQPLRDAGAAVDNARAGLANRGIAMKRDWCFALYPPSQLRRLAATLAEA